MKDSILDPKVPNSARVDKDRKSVAAALQLIHNNYDIKREKDSENELIQQLFDNGFEVATPTGQKKIPSQMLHQAIWRTQTKMKLLDFQIHGSGKPEWAEQIVTYGVGTVLDRGGALHAFRGKQGIFYNSALYGDGFYWIGLNPDEDCKYPLLIQALANDNVYFDNYATSVRAATGGHNATQCVVIVSMSWGEACRQYPKLKRNGGPGQIPREQDHFKELGRDYWQTYKLEDITEIAYFYDIRNKVSCVFGGQACTLLEEDKGDKYPFELHGKPYIPVGKWGFLPSAEGFYNHGIGSLLYRLAIVNRQLMNMAIGHVEDVTYPITLLNVPQGESAKFFNNLATAQKMRNTGKKPYVAVEYDQNAPGANQVQAQTLLPQALLNEWQLIYEQLTREIRRCGINLDDIERPNTVTATQVMAEEENQDAFVRQIQEYNAEEQKFLIEVSMDMIQKFIKKKDKTLVEMPVKVKIEEIGGEIRMDDVTLGVVSDMLRKGHYYAKMNARSGVIPSNIMQQAQIGRMLQFAPPGTVAHGKLVEQMARINDRDINIDDFHSPYQPGGGGGQQQQPGPPMPGEGEMGPGAPLPTETDMLQIGPNALDTPEPAF